MMFGCEETRRYVDAWVDGELDPGAALLVEAHVIRCTSCTAEADMVRGLKRALGGLREGAAPAAPNALRSRIAMALDAEDGVARAHEQEVVARDRKGRHARGFMIAGAALASAVMVAGRNVNVASTPGQAGAAEADMGTAGLISPVLEDIANRHAHDLPMEVSGNRPEQLTSFFSGRLDIPVRPVAFHGVPVQLRGARFSTVRDRTAAALAYDVNGRRMTVFVFDSSLLPRQGSGLQRRTLNNNRQVFIGNAHGYTVAFSEIGGVGYAVATDLPTQEAVAIIEHAQVE